MIIICLVITSEFHPLSYYPGMVAICYLLVSKLPVVSSIFTVLGISRDGSDRQPPPQPHPPLVYLNLIPLLIRSQWKTLGGVCSLWNCILVLQIESVPAVQLHTVLNMFVRMCNEIGGLYDKTNITIVAIPKKYQSFLALNDPCICTASRVRESVIPSVLSTDLFRHIP